MKYGESTFDILYLLFAVASGLVILKRAKSRAERLMGLAALILGCGDAFHLVPRVLNYFLNADLTAALRIRQKRRRAGRSNPSLTEGLYVEYTTLPVELQPLPSILSLPYRWQRLRMHRLS